MAHRSENEKWVIADTGHCVNAHCQFLFKCYSAACLYSEEGGQLSKPTEFSILQMQNITESRRLLGCPHAAEVQQEIINFAADHGIRSE